MKNIETFMAKFSSCEAKQKLLSIFNSYIIANIITTGIDKEKISSKEFLFNGVNVQNYTLSSGIEAFSRFILIFIGIWLFSILILKCIHYYVKTINFQYALLLINVSLLGIVNVYKDQENINSMIAISGIVIAVYYYVIIKRKAFSLDDFTLSTKKGYILVGIGIGLYLFIAGGLTILRYINYHQNIFDSSIFCQMYYYMSKTLLPNTTVERQRLISHFSVHFAPIYYMLLPGFMIFKSPIYLAFMKTLLVASAAIPLYKLSRYKGLSNVMSAAISITYLLFPMLIGSNIGDGNGHILNENYFYPAFLVWLFYFLEKENYKAVWIFSILTLLVKEDAPIIIASVSLYIMLAKKSYYHGKRLFITAVIYFCVCTYLIMPQFGKEVLIASYYSNFIPNNGSAFPSMLYAIIFRPSYVLQQIFTQKKILFLIQLLAPVMFLPVLAIKKNKGFLLVIPIVLTSLLCKNPCYIYSFSSHHNMTPICIVFYLTILSLSSIKSRHLQTFFIMSSLSIACIFTTSYNSVKFKELQYYVDNRNNIKLIDTALNRIPKNASVTSTDNFSTKLTNRDSLYLYFNPTCDYVVLDLRSVGDKYGESIKDLLKKNDYGVFDYKRNLYLILSKNSSDKRNNEVYYQQFNK